MAFDYARSVFSNASLEGTTQAIANSSFDRVRAGGYYRISGPFLVGAQYTRRQLKYLPVGEPVSISETVSQFMGVLWVAF